MGRVVLPAFGTNVPHEVASHARDLTIQHNALSRDLELAQKQIDTKAPLTHVDDLSGRLKKAEDMIATLIQQTQSLNNQINPPPTPSPPPTPTPPPPSPPPAPPPASGPDVNRARQIVEQTAAEFPGDFAVFPTDQEALDAAIDFLLRAIWHLNLGGHGDNPTPFTAGRQRNPSGLISNDKICVQINGVFRAFDIMTLGFANHATTLNWQEIGSPNYVPDAGKPD